MGKKIGKKIVPGDHKKPRIMPVCYCLSGVPHKECSQSPRTGLLHYHRIKINSRFNGALVLCLTDPETKTPKDQIDS